MSNKIIVLSLDGTMDSLETIPTHIAEIQNLLGEHVKFTDEDNHPEQGWNAKSIYETEEQYNDKVKKPAILSYYLDGLGAPHVDKDGHFIKWSKKPKQFFKKLEDTVEELGESAFAEGINQKVAHAYHFLATHYVPGDKVFCFGFSRGSYEAILLAKIIGRIGLINVHSRAFADDYHAQLDRAMKYAFHCTDEEALKFKAKYSYDGKDLIHFMGLFDPVKGLVAPKVPDDHNMGNVVKHLREALAADEHRIEYPNIDVQVSEESCARSCWFPGSHGDVGGDYKKLKQLSNIPLHWILEEAMDCGLPVNQKKLAEDYPQDALAPQHNSRADSIPYSGGMLPWKDISPHHERQIGNKRRGETFHPSTLYRYGHMVKTQDLDRKWVTTEYKPTNVNKAVQLLNDPRRANEAQQSVLMFNRRNGYPIPKQLPLTDKDIKTKLANEKEVRELIIDRQLGRKRG